MRHTPIKQVKEAFPEKAVKEAIITKKTEIATGRYLPRKTVKYESSDDKWGPAEWRTPDTEITETPVKMIHVVLPNLTGKSAEEEEKYIAQAIVAALEKAQESGLTYVALPVFPAAHTPDVVKCMRGAIEKFAEKHKDRADRLEHVKIIKPRPPAPPAPMPGSIGAPPPPPAPRPTASAPTALQSEHKLSDKITLKVETSTDKPSCEVDLRGTGDIPLYFKKILDQVLNKPEVQTFTEIVFDFVKPSTLDYYTEPPTTIQVTCDNSICGLLRHDRDTVYQLLEQQLELFLTEFKKKGRELTIRVVMPDDKFKTDRLTKFGARKAAEHTAAGTPPGTGTTTPTPPQQSMLGRLFWNPIQAAQNWYRKSS